MKITQLELFADPSMPSAPAPRRQPHSDEWRRAKLDSLYQALGIIGQARQTDELIFLK